MVDFVAFHKQVNDVLLLILVEAKVDKLHRDSVICQENWGIEIDEHFREVLVDDEDDG